MAALDEQSPYLIMSQPHPRRQIIRNSQDIPQCIDLKLIKRLINRRFKQRLKLMHAVLELCCRFLVVAIAISVRCRYDSGLLVA